MAATGWALDVVYGTIVEEFDRVMAVGAAEVQACWFAQPEFHQAFAAQTLGRIGWNVCSAIWATAWLGH
jgi:hypothetical protein